MIKAILTILGITFLMFFIGIAITLCLPFFGLLTIILMFILILFGLLIGCLRLTSMAAVNVFKYFPFTLKSRKENRTYSYNKNVKIETEQDMTKFNQSMKQLSKKLHNMFH